jgi:uncharacterized membrane protein YagU involved in acid resistance
MKRSLSILCSVTVPVYSDSVFGICYLQVSCVWQCIAMSSSTVHYIRMLKFITYIAHTSLRVHGNCCTKLWYACLCVVETLLECGVVEHAHWTDLRRQEIWQMCISPACAHHPHDSGHMQPSDMCAKPANDADFSHTWHHSVRLHGLQPGEWYWYCPEAATHCTRLRASLAAGTQSSFSFVMYGDMGTRAGLHPRTPGCVSVSLPHSDTENLQQAHNTTYFTNNLGDAQIDLHDCFMHLKFNLLGTRVFKRP